MYGHGIPEATTVTAGTPVPAVRAFHTLLFLILVLLLWMASPLHAGEYDDLPWTEGEGRVTFETITPVEARERALDLARKDAVAQVTGIQFTSRTDRVQIESGAQMIDRMAQSTAAETHGLIVAEEILETPIEQIEGVLQMVCRIRAKVEIENRKPDPAFRLQARLLGPESRVFRSGEELVLELEATKDCHVTVFDVSTDGTYSVLIPMERLPDNRLSAGRPKTLPSDEDRRHSPIIVGLRPDREMEEGFLFIVATREQRPFLSNEMTDLGGEFVPTARADLADFNRWLLDIAPDRRTKAEVFYSVVP